MGTSASGYEGGHWNGGHFFYNRAYNHINVRVVHNTYNYNAGNRGNYNGGNHCGNNNYNNNRNDNSPRQSDAAAAVGRADSAAAIGA